MKKKLKVLFIILIILAVAAVAVFVGLKVKRNIEKEKLGLISTFVFTEQTEYTTNRFSYDSRTGKAVAQRTPKTQDENIPEIMEYDFTQQDVEYLTKVLLDLKVDKWNEDYTEEDKIIIEGISWEISTTYQDGSSFKSVGYHFTPKEYNDFILVIQEMYPRILVSDNYMPIE